MRKWLIDYLKCYLCGSDFKIDSRVESKDEIYEGFLNCRCSSFPIINGIPRMLQKKFQPSILEQYPNFAAKYGYNLNNGKKSNSQSKTMRSFGYEWTHFDTEYEVYAEQFRDWIHPITRSQLKEKTVLDAGCGTGIHSRLLEGYGARVISVDFSSAVEVAYDKARSLKNISVIQADIAQLPLKNRFDYIFSIGSLHHMNDPKKGIISMRSKLKNRGILFLKVYSKECNFLTINLIEGIIKKMTSLISFHYLNLICFLFVIPFSLILFSYVLLSMISPNLSSKLPYYDYFLVVSKYSFRHKHNIIFDILSAPVVHYYSKSELKSLLSGLNIKHISGYKLLSWRVIAEYEKA